MLQTRFQRDVTVGTRRQGCESTHDGETRLGSLGGAKLESYTGASVALSGPYM